MRQMGCCDATLQRFSQPSFLMKRIEMIELAWGACRKVLQPLIRLALEADADSDVYGRNFFSITFNYIVDTKLSPLRDHGRKSDSVKEKKCPLRRTREVCRSESAAPACLSAASRWSWSSSRPRPWENVTEPSSVTDGRERTCR